MFPFNHDKVEGQGRGVEEMAVETPKQTVKSKTGTTDASRRRKRPPINPNYKPTTVNIDDLRNRLREESREVLRRAREY